MGFDFTSQDFPLRLGWFFLVRACQLEWGAIRAAWQADDFPFAHPAGSVWYWDIQWVEMREART